ncbi:hypothetical protein AAFF_G00270380 [Aldrovandia affinis]|uniref:Uncharacterized protein n=1 Tax=Aldrovandia affinis TaxID=143900 RepID=A0AAD7W2H5_9TELE|nr:hypothetical protein AAFF_G00270380 [Aldrovandia affinis]
MTEMSTDRRQQEEEEAEGRRRRERETRRRREERGPRGAPFIVHRKMTSPFLSPGATDGRTRLPHFTKIRSVMFVPVCSSLCPRHRVCVPHAGQCMHLSACARCVCVCVCASCAYVCMHAFVWLCVRACVCVCACIKSESLP